MGLSVIELLQEKFMQTGYSTVTEWMKDNKIELSLKSCTSVLLRGQDKGLVVMLTLASGLKCSAEEMQWIAKEKGDNTLWRLITKENISSEEEQLLNDYRALSSAQKKIVSSMIKEFIPKTPPARRDGGAV